MIRLAVAGATGRMGRCVVECVARDERFTIIAALTSAGYLLAGSNAGVGQENLKITESLDGECDVLIDFTVAEGTMAWLEVCAARKIPLVIGATGHSDQQCETIKKVSRTLPIVKAPNCSVGIQVMAQVLSELARKLGPDYDVEIVEAHHRHKIDAPSGTAILLADVIAQSTGRSSEGMIHGRKGHTGPRPKGQIGIHSIRMGEIVGQHEIHFSGPGETVTIRHIAHSRETFATGALRAAAWVIEQPPGLYTLQDVLK